MRDYSITTAEIYRASFAHADSAYRGYEGCPIFFSWNKDKHTIFDATSPNTRFKQDMLYLSKRLNLGSTNALRYIYRAIKFKEKKYTSIVLYHWEWRHMREENIPQDLLDLWDLEIITEAL